jgi:membrane-associated phospholipid phosphatase
VLQNLAHRRERSTLHLRHHLPTGQEPASKLHALVATAWSARTTRLLSILWAIGIVTFLALAVVARLHPVIPVDQQINADLQGLQGTPVTPLGKSLGDLAGPVAAVIEYVIILGLLALFRLFRELLCIAVSGPGAEVMNVVMNSLVARPRPPSYHGTTLFNLGSHSFPSGHTANAVGLYGFLFFLAVLTQRAYPKWRPWLLAAEVLCVSFVIDVGVSRILEGQHWPSDVFAGYLLGALMLMVGIALYHRLAVRAATRTQQPATNVLPAKLS